MNPRKVTDIVKQTAADLGLPESVVEKAVTFFWEDVRKTLVEMKYASVQVPNLGRFEIRAHLLPYHAERCTKYLDRTQAMSFHQATVRKDVEQRLERITKLHELCEAEKVRKAEVRSKRNGKITEGSLGQPEGNS